MTEYEERAIDSKELCNHYAKHVSAMTREGLHSKSDIAGELAYRDTEIERLRKECDHLRQQAQTWKMEAQTMTSIVNECYQAATGKTGEPGTWNGSNPVVGFILLLQQRIKMLRYAGALLSNAAYNLAQRQGRVLSESDCSSLNDARVTWDQMQRRMRRNDE